MLEPWQNDRTVEKCSLKRIDEHFTAVKFYDKLMIKRVQLYVEDEANSPCSYTPNKMIQFLFLYTIF
jgi:flagellar biosynthesis regulator FlbT